MEKEIAFVGILSNKAEENPGFFFHALIISININDFLSFVDLLSIFVCLSIYQ